MIFALWDLGQWRLRRGRYGDYQNSVMALGTESSPSREIIRSMLAGDMIFTQRLDRWFSWMMMYFSSSDVDHCGIYAGNAKVAHVTFSGTSVDPLRYISKGARILVCRPYDVRLIGEIQTREPTWTTRLLHGYPAKLQLTWAAVQFALGFYPERFRRRFLADLLLSSMVADLLLYSLAIFPICTLIVLPLLGIAIVNQIRWLFRRAAKLPPPLPASHPDLALRSCLRSGGLMFTALGPIVFGPFGTLPLPVVQAIVRSAPESGESREAAATREAFRKMLMELEVLDDSEGTS